MRGGAIPLLVWALILAVLYALIVVWTGSGLNAAMAAFAVAVTAATAFVFIALRRDALRRGEPPPSGEARSIPTASFGAVLLGVGVSATVYGFDFGHFLVYFGIGLIVAALGVLAREARTERRALRRWQRGEDR
jgi:protein-S-isoprenylcysteine O-methyltransferase Ste14